MSKTAQLDNLIDMEACIEVQKLLGDLEIPSALISCEGSCLNTPSSGLTRPANHCGNWPDCITDNPQVLSEFLHDAVGEIHCTDGNRLMPIPVYHRTRTVAYLVICLKGLSYQKTESLDRLCSQLQIDSTYVVQNGLDDALSFPKAGELISPIIRLLLEKNRECNNNSQEILSLSNCLGQAYEELSLLHRISNGTRVTQEPVTLFKNLSRDIREVAQAEEVVFLWHKEGDTENILPMMTSTDHLKLGSQNLNFIWHRTLNLPMGENFEDFLIDSNVAGDFKYRWLSPINNIVSVPIKSENKMLGTIVAINKASKPDFDSTDIKLLISVANGVAGYMENNQLYDDMQELLVGSLQALTSSIDAKDPYTCGHSARVAYISRFIAEKLQLDATLTQNTYLAGLLHDVGKIGIAESVLCKPGRLTEDEYEQIKKHPQISANILSGIKQMSQVIEGVLTHHERCDGKGYPQGLSGREIPLIGRIVQLADSFDAMTSNRTYRTALPLEIVLAELRRFSGTQFDPKLADLFLSCDIPALLSELDNLPDNVHSHGLSFPDRHYSA
ncbi:MAG: HD domain-containing protein [Phycisphaerae bacterium]|nr:HD domain-containing protein [Phycisphaerae bacterium]